MYRTSRFLVLPLALAALVLGQTSAQSATPDAPAPAHHALKTTDLFPDTVVAKGKGVEIMRSQLDEEVIRYKSQAAGRGQNISADQNTPLEQMILTQMLQLELLNAKATDADKAAGRKKAETQYAEVQKRLGAGELDRELKLLGTTREELVEKWTKLAAADAVAKRELKVDVTDADVKKYFEDNQAKFEQPELVVASHILLATRDPATHEDLSAEQKAAKHQQAEELLKRARAGENFAKLAKAYSEDPGSKDRGGQYEFARGQMVKDFENAAFSLNTNQISDLVTTPFGYHIIKLSEKIPARKISLDDDVLLSSNGYLVRKDCWRDSETVTNAVKTSAFIRQNLEAQRFQKELPAYIEGLKKEAKVEILDDRLKPQPMPESLPAGHPPLEPATKPKSD